MFFVVTYTNPDSSQTDVLSVVPFLYQKNLVNFFQVFTISFLIPLAGAISDGFLGHIEEANLPWQKTLKTTFPMQPNILLF